jgi:membrane-associated phospholipid phosphatase
MPATTEAGEQPDEPGHPAHSDAPGGLPDSPDPQAAMTEKGLPLAILKDQIPIWTSPASIRGHDLVWLIPFGAAIGTTLSTDTNAMRDISRNRTFNKDNVNASNALLGSMAAAAAGLYGVGVLKDDAHARETGILSGEALADSVIVEEAAKAIFRRERPLYNNAAGGFFVSGANSSFPSSHSTIAWTLAGVMTAQYPSKWMQFGAYSVASSISLTRVLGQEHFPTDVLVGVATGWLIARYVTRKRHVYHATH